MKPTPEGKRLTSPRSVAGGPTSYRTPHEWSRVLIQVSGVTSVRCPSVSIQPDATPIWW
jgi:hypothetical protein